MLKEFFHPKLQSKTALLILVMSHIQLLKFKTAYS
uniref:Uncharacterized protein n=1 Tax=Rhizophora mucronata TaxID=61149 RepID=A0A2P2N1Z2_RHIMU